MTLRYLVVVITLTAIGAGLLGMRQQQLNDKHAIAVWHSQMREDRETIKGLQVRIAKHATPGALREAIDRNGLRLEPIAQQGNTQASTQPQDDTDRENADEDESANAGQDSPTVASLATDSDRHQ